MSKHFLYKVKGSNDRDDIVYIETSDVGTFECNHYFKTVPLIGNCFLTHEYHEYEKIETYLTKEEYNSIIDYNNNIEMLGYGINKETDERFAKGVQYADKLKPVIEKIKQDSDEYFNHYILETEKEILIEKWNLDKDELEEILINIPANGILFIDRSMIACLYDDKYECAEEYLCSIWGVERELLKYFNADAVMDDLRKREYRELSSGRVVEYIREW